MEVIFADERIKQKKNYIISSHFFVSKFIFVIRSNVNEHRDLWSIITRGNEQVSAKHASGKVVVFFLVGKRSGRFGFNNSEYNTYYRHIQPCISPTTFDGMHMKGGMHTFIKLTSTFNLFFSNFINVL